MKSITNNKFFIIAVVGLVIFMLVVPESAFALVPGPFDYFQKVSSKISPALGQFLGTVTTIFLFYLLGLIALSSSAALLDHVTIAQSDWLNLSESVMVRIGWNFTLGLANIFMILFLVFIALQIILKIDTHQTKKALFRLLMVAFLLNFSILFIEMALDVADVFYTAILRSVETLPTTTTSGLFYSVKEALTGGEIKVIIEFSILAGVIAISSLIPGGGIKKTIILGTLGVTWLPTIAGWFIQSVLFFMIAGMFFMYIILFTARVYIIQILAILSPLAFLALILPQTKKYFSMWLNHLVQWIMLGLVLMFLLAIGVAAMNALMPQTIGQQILGAIPGFAWKGWTERMSFYLFVFIYMMVVLGIGKATIPAMGQGMISFVQGVGSMAVTQGLKPIGKSMGSKMSQAGSDYERKEKEERKIAEKAGVKYRPSKMRRAQGILTAPTRFTQRLTGTTPQRERTRKIESGAKELEEKYGKDTDSAMRAGLPLGGWNALDDDGKAGAALYLSKMHGGGKKGLGQLNNEQLNEATQAIARATPHKVEEITKHRPNLADHENARTKDLADAKNRGGGEDEAMEMALTEYRRAQKEGRPDLMQQYEKLAFGPRERTARMVQKAMVSEGTDKKPDGITFENKDIELMARAGIKIDGQDINDLVKTDVGRIKVIRAATFKKAVDAMKTSDIENLDMSTLESPIFQEMVARYRSDTNFIRKLGEEKGQQFVDKITGKMEDLGADEVAKTNMPILRALVYNPGFRSMCRPISGAENEAQLESLEEKIRPAAAARGPVAPPSLKQEDMIAEYNEMNQKFKSFKKRKGSGEILTKEEEEKMGMIETAMKDIKRRLDA